MKTFLEGGFAFLAAIVTAEIKFNYSLGDKVKDLAIYVYHKVIGSGRAAEAVVQAQFGRAKAAFDKATLAADHIAKKALAIARKAGL
jgi:hypothetical protein